MKIKDIILAVIMTVFLGTLFYWVNNQYTECENKGGAYIKGYCLNVKVLK